MRRLVWFALLAYFLLAKGVAGIRPRDSSADYPVHETNGGVTVAAALVPPDQVRKIFSTDLNRGGYIVAEVAVYPETGRAVDLSSGDFLFRMDSQTLRPVAGSAIATILATHEPNPLQPDDVTVVATANIGRATVNDPATGQRGRAVYKETGVGVGVGRSGRPPDPAAADRDRAAIQQELEDKSLPEGKVISSVAGYLYFPRPRGKAKNAAVELIYYGATNQLKLRFPVPVKP
jgi:hypothetical protein